VASVCVNTAAVLASHNWGLRLLRRSDAAALAGPAAGEVVCVLATEEAHGSDKSRIGTDAVPDGDAFVLTGMKVWGLGAAGARHFVVLAKVPGSGGTLFVVPADAAGVTLGQNEPLMGLRASGIRTVYLSGVRVAAGAMLGAPGEGASILAAEMPWLHVGVAAALTGATRGAFAAAAEFATTRVQFGKAIGTFQAVSDMVTDVDTQMHAARALTLAAAARLTEPDGAIWAARAKSFAARRAVDMTRTAIRIQGGTGFMREGGTERFARDVRALQFVGEPAHMQRDLLKRHLLDLEFEATP
jgi:alkylation response protein AidB-like acyl-CoA dehydrogenase